MCTTVPPPFVSILELPFIDSEHVRTNLQILHGPAYLRVVLQKLIKSGVSNGPWMALHRVGTRAQFQTNFWAKPTVYIARHTKSSTPQIVDLLCSLISLFPTNRVGEGRFKNATLISSLGTCIIEVRRSKYTRLCI